MTYVINESIPYKATGACSNPLYDGPYTYAWTFSDGGTATGQYITHQYTGLWGTVTATVVCTNAATGGTATSTHSDTVDLPTITVAIDSPSTGQLYAKDDTVTYVGNGGSTWDGSVLGYDWTFDSTTITANETTTHVWLTTGEHTTSVIATDTITGAVSEPSSTNTVTVYEAGWNERGDVQPYFLRSAITVDLPDGRIMYCGGYDSAGATESTRCLIFNGLTWTRIADMNYARTSYLDYKGLKGVYLGNNKVFIAGGQTTYSGPVYGYEIYDLDTDEWTFIDTSALFLFLPRYGSCPIGIGNGKVYMSHGWNGESWNTAVYIIDTIGSDSQIYAGFATSLGTYRTSRFTKPLLLSTGEIAIYDYGNGNIIFAQNPSTWTHTGVEPAAPFGYITQFVSKSVTYSGGDGCHMQECNGFLYVYEISNFLARKVKKCDLSVTPASRSFVDAADVPGPSPQQFETYAIDDTYILLVGGVVAETPYLGSVIYDTVGDTYANPRFFSDTNVIVASSNMCHGMINHRPIVISNPSTGALNFNPEVLVEPSPYF
jgi:hypothetical protein